MSKTLSHELVQRNGAGQSSPITVNWQACTAVDANKIEFKIENTDTEEGIEYEFDNLATGLGFPKELETGAWKLDLDFLVWYEGTNEDGIPTGIGKYSESDYFITIE